MGADRAVAAGEAAAFPLSGPQAARRPAGVAGDLVRVAQRDRLGASAARARLWLRHDGLAAASRLAAGRSVGAAARTAARRAARVRPVGMGARDRRLQPSAGEKGGAKTGPSPVDRGRAGSKHHLLVDGGGIPLAWTITGGNRNDATQLLELLDRVPPVRGRAGRPRRRPRTLIADRGYDHDKYRRPVWKRGVKPIIVERTFAWLHNRRRLLLRTDRRDDIHEAFLALACCLICWQQLETSS